MKSKWIFIIAGVFLLAGCGGVTGGGGSSAQGSGFSIVVENPNPNASGTSKAVAFNSAISKEVSASVVDLCTLTISASDISTISQTATVASGAASVSFSGIEVPYGSGRSIAVACHDQSETSSNIPIGFTGETTGVEIGNNSSVSITGKFLNLGSDGTGDAGQDIHFVRFHQPNSVDTRFDITFASNLSDTQKSAVNCYIDFNATAASGTDGKVDSVRTDGKTCGLKKDRYFKISGGLLNPLCELFDSGDTRITRGVGSWQTTSDSKSIARCRISTTHMKEKIDSNQQGGWCAVCVEGATSDAVPNNGFAKFDFSGNTGSSAASLVSNGNACTSDTGCDSGYCRSAPASCSDGSSNECFSNEDCSAGGTCILSGTCISPEPVSLGGNVSISAGPDEGTTTNDSTDGTGEDARFSTPDGVCISPDGARLYVADNQNHIIREITVPGAVVSTIAGLAGNAGRVDGTGNAARFNSPQACAVEASGAAILIVDNGSNNIRRLVIATDAVTSLAGDVSSGSGTADGEGTDARFDSPIGITSGRGGDSGIYITDTSNHTIRKLVLADNNAVTTFAGSAGNAGTADGTGSNARFNLPVGIVIDATDSVLYVTDRGNSTIRKIVIATGAVTTIAGTAGISEFANGTGTDAKLGSPHGIALDPTGSVLYVSEVDNSAIRKIVLSTLAVTTLAGSGIAGDSNATGGNNFNEPSDIALNPLGTVLYIGDSQNNKIRHIQ
ncbi:MAG: hypothetical protein Q8P84_07330 [Deltaproteobacteria bacterium]|nr:hypothetical protein [Deltaproteobacteria bacterium]